jgi:hypothetical protein
MSNFIPRVPWYFWFGLWITLAAALSFGCTKNITNPTVCCEECCLRK